MKTLIPLLFFLLIGAFAHAATIKSVKGHAVIDWTRNKKSFHFDQAIVIDGLESAHFETLDDFGNTLFKMALLDNNLILARGVKLSHHAYKKLKTLLQLPIEKNEFLSFLLYQLPMNHHDFIIEMGCCGLLFGEKKANKKKKSYKIWFRELKLRGNIYYPTIVEIKSYKSHLKLEWKDVSLKY